jgi:hypothetical protein
VLIERFGEIKSGRIGFDFRKELLWRRFHEAETDEKRGKKFGRQA